MVSTIVVFRLQQSLSLLSLPPSLWRCVRQGLSKGAEGYSFCLLPQINTMKYFNETGPSSHSTLQNAFSNKTVAA